MAVIFVIIFLPIILVSSYYIGLQVETIQLQEEYDKKLLDATYDAMSAFEINTANEDLSSVADSLRSIIAASNNIFFNTLVTNLGMSNASKSYVQPYVPAILYTLYDGYYIYAPTNTPVICTDKYGQTIRTSDIGVRYVNNGVYKFEKDKLTYTDGTTTANASTASGEDVKYSQAGEDYGQILYQTKKTYEDGGKTYYYYTTKIQSTGEYSTYYKQSYILKSYISYDARYASGDIDINVNYTLDNFITIDGTIKNIYYTKSGYLISDGLIKTITVSENSRGDDNTQLPRYMTKNQFTITGYEFGNWKVYSAETWDEIFSNPTRYQVTVQLTDGTTISTADSMYTYSDNGVTKYGFWDDAISSVKYYIDAWTFSGWVYTYLGDLTEGDLVSQDYTILASQASAVTSSDKSKLSDATTKVYDKMFYSFSGSNTKIFDATKDPEDSESAFNTHKRNVVKNSITYNLILSMIAYTEQSRLTEYSMPVLSDEDWDRILSNVSITTFMQGLSCGLKYYNNYMIVTSTNNEISVTPNEIYYVPRVDSSNNLISIDFSTTELENGVSIPTAHRIDCSELTDAEYYTSFKSKEIKYDKIYNKTISLYLYDHMVYTGYECIVDSNYKVTNFEDDGTPNGEASGNTNAFLIGIDSSGNSYTYEASVVKWLINGTKASNNISSGAYTLSNMQNRLKAYRIAVAKEKNNLYKSIAFDENYGYISLTDEKTVTYTPSGGDEDEVRIAVVNSDGFGGGYDKDARSSSYPKINEIAKIEITLENTEKITGVPTVRMQVALNGVSYYTYNTMQTVSTTSKTTTTFEFKQDFSNSNNGTLTEIYLSFYKGDGVTPQKVTTTIKSIKIYYK
jgi:hypothetical protein